MRLKVTALFALVVLGLTAWLVRTTATPEPGSLAAHEEGAEPDSSTPELDEPEMAAADISARSEVERAEEGEALPGEPPSEDKASAPSSLQVNVTWRDGTPAAEVALLLRSSDEKRYRLDDRWSVTDAAGIVTFRGLVPSEYTIEADRGAEETVTIGAGESQQLDLRLTGAFDVYGTVQTSDGRGVSSAEIVAVNLRVDWRGSRQVATSRADGSFTVRCMEKGHSLGAFASGWAPSELFDLSSVAPGAAKNHVTKVKLTLKEFGADVWGTVSLPSGEPLEGALVALGSATLWDNSEVNGEFREGPKPHVVKTDENGRYRIRGAAPGKQPLAAWHPDWPAVATEVEIVASVDQRVDLRLAPGVTVKGVVSLSSGEPAAGAHVIALPEHFEDRYPGQGPTDEGSPFAHPRTQADAQGRFELGPIAAGDVHMYASLGTSWLTKWTGEEPVYQGECQETLRAPLGASLGAPLGAQLTWNPTLTLGLVIQGTAKYADGSPIKHAFVSAESAEGHDRAVTTDETGTFTIPELKPTPYRVALQMPPSAPASGSVGAFYDVVPATDDLAFVADCSPSPRQERGRVRLRVDDEAGIGAKLAQGPVMPVLKFLGQGSWMPMRPDEDGVFSEKVRPGSFRLDLSVGHRVVRFGEVFEVKPGETVDLGTLKTVPLGSLTVNVIRPEGVTGPVTIRPKFYSSESQTLAAEEASTTLVDVGPGPFELDVRGEGIVRETVSVDVAPGGASSSIEVRLRPAATVQLECTLQQPRNFRALHLVVTGVDGTIWQDRRRREIRMDEWPFSVEIKLPVGSYSANLETSDGQSARAAFTVRSADENSGENSTVRVHAR